MKKKVWDNRDSKLLLVIGDESWRFILDFASFQPFKAAFAFANSSHQVIYVGFTQGNCVVNAITKAMGEGKHASATLVKVLYTKFDKDANIIARILTEKYAPIYNTLVERLEHSERTLYLGITPM
jgi:hypothetical protein